MNAILKLARTEQIQVLVWGNFEIFFLIIFDQCVFESVDSELTDIKGQLCTAEFCTCIKKSPLENMVEVRETFSYRSEKIGTTRLEKFGIS